MRFIRREPSSSDPCRRSWGKPGIIEAILDNGPLRARVREGEQDWSEVRLHVHDILDLFSPVTDAELALLKLLRHLLLLVRVLRRDVLHVLDEALHVAQPEQLGDERLRRELVQVVEVLADAEEDDRRLGRRDAAARETGSCLRTDWTYAEIAPPPFAWPSIFVTMIAPKFALSLNARAWASAA